MKVPAIIAKTSADLRVEPNLVDYDGERHRFSWAAAARELAIEPGGGINIGWQAVDRHCSGPGRDRIALRFLSRNARPRTVSYAELATLTDRFCNVLRGLGIGKAMGEHCLDEARRLGFRAMQFNFVVSTNAAALGLWERLGFATVGTLPGAFRHRTHGFVDAYVMFRTLT